MFLDTRTYLLQYHALIASPGGQLSPVTLHCHAGFSKVDSRVRLRMTLNVLQYAGTVLWSVLTDLLFQEGKSILACLFLRFQLTLDFCTSSLRLVEHKDSTQGY